MLREASFCICTILEPIIAESEWKSWHVNYRRYTPDFYLPDADQYIEVKALRKDGLYDRNLACVKKLQEMGYNVTLVPMKEFYQMLRSTGLYDTIPNLENRDYRGTLELIYS